MQDLIEALKEIDEKAPEVLHLLYQVKMRRNLIKDKLGLNSKELKRITRKSLILIFSNIKLVDD